MVNNNNNNNNNFSEVDVINGCLPLEFKGPYLIEKCLDSGLLD